MKITLRSASSGWHALRYSEGRGYLASEPRPSGYLRACHPTRSGFTIVELLVAMALTIFVMTILSQAFIVSLDTFSGLKAIGDMQSNLRTGAGIIQADLTKPHFEGLRRLRDPDILTNPPKQGFFAIFQGSAAYEGTDAGFPAPPPIGYPAVSPDLRSFRAANHVLYFTVRSQGNRPESFFSAPAGAPLLNGTTTYFNLPPDGQYQTAGTFTSQWAEVAYFLVNTGSTGTPGIVGSTAGTPLYALYRAEYLLVPNPILANQALSTVSSTTYRHVSCYNKSGPLVFNAPEDVATPTTPQARMFTFSGPPPWAKNGEALPTPPAPQVPHGAGLVLSNVLSFQVQALTSTAPLADFHDFAFPNPSFDSGNNTAQANIFAVRIVLRVWDNGTKQARQITLVQDM